MAKSNNIEKKIKESFESVKHKAPENLWSNINDSLFPNATDLDNKVKTSFEGKTDKAPEGIWEGIDKQLTIDKGWTKVRGLLQRRTFYKWTKRIAAFMIFLFFVRPEYGDGFSGASEELNINANSFTANEINPNALADPGKNVRTARLSSKSSSDDITSTKPSGEKVNYIDNNLLSNSNESLQAGLIKEKKEIPVITKNNLKSEKDEAFRFENNAEHKKTDVSAFKLEGEEKNNLELTDSKDLITLSAKPFNSFLMNDDNRKLIDIKIELRKESKYELGLFTALNTTAILNNRTRRALDSKSLVAFNPTFGANLGLQFVYHLKEKHGVVGNLTYANINQSYGFFSKGSFSEEELTTNFVRLQAMYQFRYERFEISKAAFNAKLGPYVGLLTSSSYSINDQMKNESVDYFKSYDLGVTLQIGQSYEFNKLVFDYGLNIDKGLSNLNKGTEKVPASFDRSTILGLGGYFSLRYKL